MTTDFRALCAKLLDWLERASDLHNLEAYALIAGATAALKVEPGEGQWSEGICGDGAAILRDGVMVPIEEVVQALNCIPATPPAPVPSHDLTNAAPLLWLLWNHQGSQSPVGRPIREYLGMGQFDSMTDAQIEAAKQYAECETCQGLGTIDERLGGWSTDNPAATCPDCDGVGEARRFHRPASATAALNGEVGELVEWLKHGAPFPLSNSGPTWRQRLYSVVSLLERQSAEGAALRAAPVPVSDRLPGEEDLHPEGKWCWGWKYGRYWAMMQIGCFGGEPDPDKGTHWRPYNTIPLPQPEGGLSSDGGYEAGNMWVGHAIRGN